MTAGSTEVPSAAPTESVPLIRQIWGAPLWAHALVLLVVLVGVAALARPGSAATSDEGAAVAQARLLQRGTWLFDNPLSSIDPDGEYLPFPSGDAGTKGMAPYARHPLYAELSRVADDLGGVNGLVGLSVLGALGAAVAGALLAKAFRPDLARPSLWVLGVGSPLLFDANVILAHTLAVAAFGFATVAALAFLRSTGAARVAALVGVGLLVAATAGFRTEGAFAGLGLAAGAGTVAWIHRSGRWQPAALLAGVAGAAAVVTVAVEHELRIAITGAAMTAAGEPVAQSSTGWLPGRFEALWNDWFDPGLGAVPRLLVIAMVATTIVLAFAARQTRRSGPDLLAGTLVAAAAVYLVRLVSSPPVEIFGLMVAFPLLWIGVMLVRRADVEGTVRVLLVVTTLVLTAGVLLTDYPLGGSIEWGGRYFAIGLPLAVPIVLDALDRVRVSWRPRRATVVRVGGVALVAVTLLTSLLAVRVLRARHDDAASLHRAVVGAAAEAGPVGSGRASGSPVVLVGNRLVPQLLYDDLFRFRWLAAGSDAAMQDASTEAAAAGIDRMVVIGGPADGSAWPGWREVSRRSSHLGSVAVIERCASDAC